MHYKPADLNCQSTVGIEQVSVILDRDGSMRTHCRFIEIFEPMRYRVGPLGHNRLNPWRVLPSTILLSLGCRPLFC
jgi:hypothetical protein